MNETTEHPISSASSAMTLLAGVILLGLTVACFYALFPLGSPYGSDEIAAAIGAVVFLCAALWCARVLLRAQSYTVFLSDSGIRIGPSGRWIPWSQIRRVRERVWLQRFDLLDRENRLLGAIESQIENAPYVIRAVRDRIGGRGITSALPVRRFGRRRSHVISYLVMSGAFTAFFVSLWVADPDESPWLLLIVPVIIIGFLNAGKEDILQLDLTRDELQISRLWKTTRVHRDQILVVELDLEGGDFRGRFARTAIQLENGELLRVVPVGVDAETVHRVISDWKGEASETRPPQGSKTRREVHR